MNKTAIVTGASRGIGREIALALAESGYNLALCCKTNKDMLDSLKKECENLGAQVLCYVGDMGVAADVASFFDKIRQHFSSIDVLVNNAGISYVGLFQDMTTEEWDNIVSSNLSSAFYCCRQAVPDMLKNHSGKIINISSIWGEVGASMEVAYSATKGGINSLTKAMAKELAPSSIQVNGISCGFIHTDMNNCFSQKEQQAIFDEIPSGRGGTPKEVAELVIQLLNSPTYLTGQLLRLDGGWY